MKGRSILLHSKNTVAESVLVSFLGAGPINISLVWNPLHLHLQKAEPSSSLWWSRPQSCSKKTPPAGKTPLWGEWRPATVKYIFIQSFTQSVCTRPKGLPCRAEEDIKAHVAAPTHMHLYNCVSLSATKWKTLSAVLLYMFLFFYLIQLPK